MTSSITKADAARRQLLAAIHLHWYFDEPLAAYTLAANAWELSDALLEKVGRLRMVEAFTKMHGEPENTFRKLINTPRNFFKHADRDPEATIDELSLEDTDTVIMIACMDYMVLSPRRPLLIDYFVAWYSAIYPKKTGAFFREEADRVFERIVNLDREEQLVAARFVADQLDGAPDTPKNEKRDDYRWTPLHRWSHSRTS